MDHRKKPRVKRSVIYKLDDQEFIKLVNNSYSLTQILRTFGRENKGGSGSIVRRRINELQLSTNHFNQTKAHPRELVCLESVMVKNSTYSRGSLKRRIIEESILPYQCEECGVGSEWNQKQLILVLDHKNGVHNDHRLSNLRFLCPNCNSQQPTFAGRNKKYK